MKVLTEVALHEKFAFLADPHPYKILYGGRDGMKSWAIAQQLVINLTKRNLRWLCARETQKSMKDSVHKLLCDTIMRMDLGDRFKITEDSIVGRNGTKNKPPSEFLFAGIKEARNIKSYESCDGAWVEEGQAVKKRSWDILLPTIRKAGSEIWVSLNPDLATDATYMMWIVNPPPGAMVVKVGWQDNLWLSDESRAKIEHMRETDPETFEHVYEGVPRSTVEGAIYKQEIAAAEKAGRITRVAHDATRPVDVYFDLGYADAVSMWFAQAFPFEYRIIDFYEDSHQAIDWYLRVIQQKEYVIGTIWLPWDGGSRSLGTGRSIEELIRAKGFKVRVLPQAKVHEGINAVRTLFPQMWFDGERCAEGLQYLRRYQWGPPSAAGIARREPLHDDASHASDALRTLAMSIQAPKKQEPAKAPPVPYRTQSPYRPFG